MTVDHHGAPRHVNSPSLNPRTGSDFRTDVVNDTARSACRGSAVQHRSGSGKAGRDRSWRPAPKGESAEVPRFAIDRLPIGRHHPAVTVSIPKQTLFHSLGLIGAEGGAQPSILVPPLPGHFPILLSDMVLGLLRDFRAAVLDRAHVHYVPVVGGTDGFPARAAVSNAPGHGSTLA